MNHGPQCKQPTVMVHGQIRAGLKVLARCLNCGATDSRPPRGDAALRHQTTSTNHRRNTKMTQLEALLVKHGLPPQAARFLPDGPDIAKRAADLADLINRIKVTAATDTVTLETSYGRN